MADLTAPLVPGASSISEVIARATQAASIQSAQILSAARNIAADRQRAGEMAADAVVRMRLEDFQREQFRQKKSIEDARLGIALSANRRAEERAPLEMGLLQAEIDQAPLRTALMGAQLTGANLGNAFDATRLANFPEDRERLLRRDDVAFGSANVDYLKAQREEDDLAIARNDMEALTGMMMSTNTGEDLSYNLSMLEQMSTPGSGSSVLTDPRSAEIYNMAVEKLSPSDEIRERLRIPGEVISAIQPDTDSLGLRRTSEARLQLDAERDAKIGAAEARIREIKSKKELLKNNSTRAAKAEKAALEKEQQAQERAKAAAQEEFNAKLQRLKPGLVLPSGEGGIDTTLVDPSPGTSSAVQDLLRGLN